jgi:hypothetical protein
MALWLSGIEHGRRSLFRRQPRKPRMTISLGNLTVSANASVGTVIGALSAKQGSTVIPCTFNLITNPNNYFAISGNNLVTAKSGGMAPGQYSVQINATPVPLSDATALTITVTAPPPPTPPRPNISPDGSILMAGSTGSLVTSAGTSTFGWKTGPGGNQILLNGSPAGTGYGVELEVNNGGNMYTKNALGTWYKWNGSSWTVATAPS